MDWLIVITHPLVQPRRMSSEDTRIEFEPRFELPDGYNDGGLGRKSQAKRYRAAEAVRPTLAVSDFHTPIGTRRNRRKIGSKTGPSVAPAESLCYAIEGLRATAPVIHLFARSVECERNNSGEQK